MSDELHARIYLSVPYAEKDVAKQLGARWDPQAHRWYVREEDDLVLLVERWLHDEPLPERGSLRLSVMLLARLCHRCRRRITCVLGLRLPHPYAWVRQASIDVVPYLPVEFCGPALDDLIGPPVRSRLAIGSLQYLWDFTRTFPSDRARTLPEIRLKFHPDIRVPDSLSRFHADIPALRLGARGISPGHSSVVPIAA